VCVCVPISVAARSEAEAFLRLLSGLAGSSPTGDMDVSYECCLWSGRGICDGTIPRQEEPYRVWWAVISMAQSEAA